MQPFIETEKPHSRLAKKSTQTKIFSYQKSKTQRSRHSENRDFKDSLQDSSPDVKSEDSSKAVLGKRDIKDKEVFQIALNRHHQAEFTIKSNYDKKIRLAQNLVTMTNSNTRKYVFNQSDQLPDLFGPFHLEPCMNESIE